MLDAVNPYPFFSAPSCCQMIQLYLTPECSGWGGTKVGLGQCPARLGKLGTYFALTFPCGKNRQKGTLLVLTCATLGENWH